MERLLVATERGLWEFPDGGDPVAFQDRSVDALDRPGEWAIVDGHELWRRDGSWDRVARGPDLRLACVEGRGDDVYVGTSEAHLLKLFERDLQLVDSFENVDGRPDWFTPWGGPPAVRSIAVSPGGRVFVGVHVGGIVRGDGPGSWEPTIDISADVHEVRIDADRELVVAACAVGFAESGDGGFAWSFDDENLHATYARAVAVSDDYILMSVSRGPRGGDAAIYRESIEGTEGFELCTTGIHGRIEGNIDTGCLDANGMEVAFGTIDGSLYLSGDQGTTWSEIASRLPPINYVRFIE